MKVSKEQITAFIPQRAPFIMVDNLIEAEENEFVTDFRVEPENIFLEDGVLREFALIENIAQSSAAGLAFLNRNSASGPVDGFIGGISRLKLFQLPGLGDTLLTVVTKRQQLGNMYMFHGEIFVRKHKLIECDIKLAGMIGPDR